ncbi:hypothetical protein HK100_009523 [Physocladia obscura]|uniref:BZIP domain-containing protein n=1 Tax=Physocladia obscura TaxID=109957 RepID=A0AAD5T3Y4_9FUNG|nr:hypothetical protein HK100_009523 [Physocladia obscura]
MRSKQKQRAKVIQGAMNYLQHATSEYMQLLYENLPKKGLKISMNSEEMTKKRGRKPIVGGPSRQEQMREAQRTHRERQRSYVHNLETEVETLKLQLSLSEGNLASANTRCLNLEQQVIQLQLALNAHTNSSQCLNCVTEKIKSGLLSQQLVAIDGAFTNFKLHIMNAFSSNNPIAKNISSGVDMAQSSVLSNPSPSLQNQLTMSNDSLTDIFDINSPLSQEILCGVNISRFMERNPPQYPLDSNFFDFGNKEFPSAAEVYGPLDIDFMKTGMMSLPSFQNYPDVGIAMDRVFSALVNSVTDKDLKRSLLNMSKAYNMVSFDMSPYEKKKCYELYILFIQKNIQHFV